MGLRTKVADLLWNVDPSLAAGALALARNLGSTSKIFETLHYQSEFVSKERPFPCWWVRNPLPGNAGDLLTPLLLQSLFGVSPIYSARREFLGAGSIVKQARPGTVVWGSGLMSPDIVVPRGPTFLAVRGPLTREALLRQGHSVPETYGDPAILMPLVYAPPNMPPQHNVGFIPHFTHQKLFDSQPEAFKIINILRGTRSEIFRLIDEIMQCDAIFASSLHGLILAAVYGKPVAWIRFPRHGTKGDTFKFRDFFSSIGAPDLQPADLDAPDEIGAIDIGNAVKLFVPSTLQERLIASIVSFYDFASP